MEGLSKKIENYIDIFVQENKDTDIVDLDFFSDCKGNLFPLSLDIYEVAVRYASEKNMRVALIIPLSQSEVIKDTFTEHDFCIDKYNLPGYLFYGAEIKVPEDMGLSGIVQTKENTLRNIRGLSHLHIIYQQVPDVDCVYRYLYFYQP